MAGDADRILPTLCQLIYQLDPAVPVTETRTLEDRLRSDLSDVRTASFLTGTAGLLAVILSAIGLSGVLILAVNQRVREMGVRRALGTGERQITGLIVRDAIALSGIAIGFGLVAALALGSALEHFLYGTSCRDPWVLGGALAVLTLISLVASWWPARIAAEIDPIEALRRQ